MEQYHLQLFLLNILLVLLDASLGYHIAPRLLSGVEEPRSGTALKVTRGLLPAIVALYMFFNCLGYFQALTHILLIVTFLVLADLGVHVCLRRKRQGAK
jgi:uncharacterized protein YacL